MLVALPVYQRDINLALNLLNWIQQLGGCPAHESVIVADAATPAGLCLQLRQAALRCFHSTEIITNPQSVLGWPQGPNSLWLAAANYAKHKREPFLFLETDAIPLMPNWLDQIAIHYRAKGARYLGRLVPCQTPGMPVQHFTGVGVYPDTAYDELASMIRGSPNTAFDLSTAGYLAPIATDSELIQHLWGEKNNAPKFASRGIPGTSTFGLDYLHPKAVIFHRNKDHSLIRMLRLAYGVTDPVKTFIQLGRNGDIILLLPALKYIADTTGMPPRLIVAQEYAAVLDGVSYVEPVPLPVHWWSGMPEARRYAESNFGGAQVLQCYASEWGIELSQWPNFMWSMIDRTGVDMGLFHSLPLVFDQRDVKRERQYLPQVKGPYITINTAGVSSPFPHTKIVVDAIRYLDSRIHIVNISHLRCHRIYDLLGVMDHSLGGIHIDSATLHLAHGCNRPYIAFTMDGWTGSVPRGNCVLQVKYSQVPNALPKIADTVKQML